MTAAPRRRDAGTALVGSLVGVLLFLTFLFTAVQLLTRLYAASTLTAVATDAARSVASRRIDHRNARSVEAAEATAESLARHRLGAYGRRARFDWWMAGQSIHLRVRVDSTRLAFGGLRPLHAFDRVDRTVVLRLEDPT